MANIYGQKQPSTPPMSVYEHDEVIDGIAYLLPFEVVRGIAVMAVENGGWADIFQHPPYDDGVYSCDIVVTSEKVWALILLTYQEAGVRRR